MSRLFAALYDPVMRSAEKACLVQWRSALLEHARGEVLEIGAGTGANLPFFTTAVTRLVLAEPDFNMHARLRERLGLTRVRKVERVAAHAAALPFDDESFDSVVSTLVLCSVPDPSKALAELQRVLRPNGRLIFLEHVAADERPSKLTWQRRIEPFWKPISGNCHLTRRTAEAIRGAGFFVDWEKREGMRKALPFLGPSVRGVARRGL